MQQESAATQLPSIDHTTANLALALRRVQCTTCQKVVTMNVRGRCPATLRAGQQGGGTEPRKTFQPYVVVEPVVVGNARARYMCNVIGQHDQPHGNVVLTVKGECPHCARARTQTAWQQHHDQRAAEQAAAAVPPSNEPDIVGEGMEAVIKDVPALETAPFVPEATAVTPKPIVDDPFQHEIETEQATILAGPPSRSRKAKRNTKIPAWKAE